MRAILSDIFKCSRCGLQNVPGSTHCAACGLDLNTSSNTGTNTAAPITHRPPVPVPAHSPVLSRPAPGLPATSGVSAVKSPLPSISATAGSASRGGVFRRSTLEGTIIHAGLSHLTYPPFRWEKFLVQLVAIVVAFLVFGTIALIITAALFLFSILISWLFQTSGRSGGFLHGITAQFVGFYLTSRLLGQKPTIPVCDYRLRTSSGDEYLVRVEGYVSTGAMHVGDDVLVEGRNRGGTLVLKRGWNKRLNTAIRVKLP